MEKIVIKKSPPLKGEVKISGCKNAALPIIAASVMCEGESIIKNVPHLSDVSMMLTLCERFGCETEHDKSVVKINPKINKTTVSYEDAGKFRASVLMCGAILAKCGKVKIPLPGGCPIGVRPIDLHLKGFLSLGAKVSVGHGFISVSADSLVGGDIYLDFPSVGATENLIMAACMAKGRTNIKNAAREPEIDDLINFLTKCGAKIRHVGASVSIDGAESLSGCEYAIMPDRIEAGTYIACAAATGGSIVLSGANANHMLPVVAKMREMGMDINFAKNSIIASAEGRMHSSDIKTMPYPGYPTDMQAQTASVMSISEGTSLISENIFENRFLYVPELVKMGADIKTEGRFAVVEGVRSLSGAKVSASDLRSGAALIVAALAARGETEIADIYHIERGYENIVEKLSGLGAIIDYS